MYQFRLIGYPISHSLSPWIHEEFLRQTKLSGTYQLHEIKDFPKEITAFKQEEINGFNVTVPYKEEIIPYVDELDESAKVIGAVNTVVVKDGKWIGYNTDGIGYVRALQEAYPVTKDMTDKRIVILGAGGAAKGIYAACKLQKAHHIVIANRTTEKAEQIIALYQENSDDVAVPLTNVSPYLEQADIIIQTSSVGMKPHIDDVIVPLPTLKQSTIVSDIVYQPMETAFLKQAKQQGVRIHYGHTMLLYQAQYAFEIWTNKRPVVGDMADKLQHILEG